MCFPEKTPEYETPEEIGMSIVAEPIQVRNQLR